MPVAQRLLETPHHKSTNQTIRQSPWATSRLRVSCFMNIVTELDYEVRNLDGKSGTGGELRSRSVRRKVH
jgi:hypothetical protein